jgi:uncharacterized protein (TIGR02117 family)
MKWHVRPKRDEVVYLFTFFRRISRYRSAVFGLLLAVLCAGCGAVSPIAGLYPPPEPAAAKCLYVYRDGRHTGLMLPAAQIDPSVWPESLDFQEAQFLEVSTGEKNFFYRRNTGISNMFKSLLWPSERVLRVIGLAQPFENVEKAKHGLISLEVSQEGFAAITAFIRQSYARDANGQPIRLGPASYGHGSGWFYQAMGHYHLLNTCNVWTAKALRQAGFPIRPLQAILASGVMKQIREGQQRFNQPGIEPARADGHAALLYCTYP